jgi:MFS transporter, PAT family, solute carrier family 33 (acetyl-CoA transportor), member 1
VKVLYAPIIDSIYLTKFGRRKTWICSAQLIIGIFMITSCSKIEDWLGDGADHKPNVLIFTVIFFTIVFLTSVQDIAVDAWGLTLLKPRNVGYTATCNSVGQAIGNMAGFKVFLVLESKDFCNKYIFSEPQEIGLITLSGFLLFWGVIYLIVTFLVAFFWKEDSEIAKQLDENTDYGIKQAYPTLLKIIKLKPVQKLCLIFVSNEGIYCVVESLFTLKLIEYGMPRDKFALFSLPAIFSIFSPLFITKFTTGRKPLSFYYKLVPLRLSCGILYALLVFVTPKMLSSESTIHLYYACFTIIFLLHQA